MHKNIKCKNLLSTKYIFIVPGTRKCINVTKTNEAQQSCGNMLLDYYIFLFLNQEYYYKKSKNKNYLKLISLTHTIL